MAPLSLLLNLNLSFFLSPLSIFLFNCYLCGVDYGKDGKTS